MIYEEDLEGEPLCSPGLWEMRGWAGRAGGLREGQGRPLQAEAGTVGQAASSGSPAVQGEKSRTEGGGGVGARTPVRPPVGVTVPTWGPLGRPSGDRRAETTPSPRPGGRLVPGLFVTHSVARVGFGIRLSRSLFLAA